MKKVCGSTAPAFFARAPQSNALPPRPGHGTSTLFPTICNQNELKAQSGVSPLCVCIMPASQGGSPCRRPTPRLTGLFACRTHASVTWGEQLGSRPECESSDSLNNTKMNKQFLVAPQGKNNDEKKKGHILHTSAAMKRCPFFEHGGG